MDANIATTRRRHLTLFLSTLTLASNIASVFVLHYFPDDPFHLAAQISIYSYLAGGISLLGFIGAYKRNATFVTVYANHLLLDAMLCTVPRVLLMVFLSGMRQGFCEEHVGTWLQLSDNVAIRPGVTLEDVRLQNKTEQQRCMRVLWGIQAAVAVAAVVTTTAQWMLAMRIRTYGKRLAETDSSDFMVRESQRDVKRNVFADEHSLI
ncbi:MAG: hypothetical protein M1822_007665 [Bathelium mastoideum]|nr:MAG: hypothetical protein M1822_007665 [Bathelium mastoideum]